jgi:hypothetical protein
MRESLGRFLSWLLVILGLCAAAVPAFGSNDWEKALPPPEYGQPVHWTVHTVAAYIIGWPDVPRWAADKLLEKYGVPDEIASGRLQWNDRGDRLYTTVYRDEDLMRRSGVLEQSVRYQVPVGKWQDLSALAIGVSYDSVEAALVASSESEETNNLALNVAMDVVRGRRGVDEAREFYRRTLNLALSGKTSRYTRSLLFRPTPINKERERPPWLQPLMP